MARTVYNNHQRYLSAYMRPYPGYYFTGDECYRDQDGYYWIIGRVDGTLHVSCPAHLLTRVKHRCVECEWSQIGHRRSGECVSVAQWLC